MTIKGHKPRPFDRVRWDTAPIWDILARRRAQGRQRRAKKRKREHPNAKD